MNQPVKLFPNDRELQNNQIKSNTNPKTKVDFLKKITQQEIHNNNIKESSYL